MKTTHGSQAKLAQALHVSTTSLRAWSKLPGAPASWGDAAKWRAFIEENGLGIVGNRVSADREKLLVEMLRENLRIARVKRMEVEKTVCEVTEIEALLSHLALLSKATLYASLTRELPGRAAGLSAAEIGVLGKGIADRITDILREGIARFEAEHPTQSARIDALATKHLAGALGNQEQAAGLVRDLRSKNLLAIYENSEISPSDFSPET